MASFDPHHSLYEEEQATKYPHFTHVETESEKMRLAQVMWRKAWIRQSEET